MSSDINIIYLGIGIDQEERCFSYVADNPEDAYNEVADELGLGANIWVIKTELPIPNLNDKVSGNLTLPEPPSPGIELDLTLKKRN